MLIKFVFIAANSPIYTILLMQPMRKKKLKQKNANSLQN